MDSLLTRLRKAESIFLVSHLNPDGDAAASVLALKAGLEQLGKRAEGCLKDGMPSAFAFLLEKGEGLATEPPETPPDLCVILDASDSQRTGYPDWIRQMAKEGRLAYVDHHTQGDLAALAQAELRDPKASSTAELVFHLLLELGVRLTPGIATRLLTGIYTDTGGFMFPNTTPACMDAAAELLRRGGKLQLIVQKLELSKSLAELRLLGLALERAGKRRHSAFLVSLLTAEDFAHGTADNQGIVGQLNSMDETRATLLLSEEEEGQVRGSLRVPASSKLQVHRLARILGGGGHARAAGFTVPGHIRKEGERWRIVPE